MQNVSCSELTPPLSPIARKVASGKCHGEQGCHVPRQPRGQSGWASLSADFYYSEIDAHYRTIAAFDGMT